MIEKDPQELQVNSSPGDNNFQESPSYPPRMLLLGIQLENHGNTSPEEGAGAMVVNPLLLGRQTAGGKTLREGMDEFRARYRSRGLELDAYNRVYDLLCTSVKASGGVLGDVENLPLERLREADVRRFLMSVDGQVSAGDIKPSTRYVRQDRLKRILNFFADEGYIPHSMARLVKAERPELKSGLRWVDPQLYPDILHVIEEISLQPEVDVLVFSTMMTLGARSVEMARLRFKDIDLAQSTAILDGKGRFERCVPLPSCLVEGFRLLSGKARSRDDYVLPDKLLRSGLPERRASYVNGYLNRLYRTAAQRLDLCDRARGVHVFRHVFITALIESGVSLDKIMAITGLRSMSTLGIYVDVDEYQMREDFLSKSAPAKGV